MSGLGRASALIGAGTLISRLTGFVRTMVLVAAIGSVGSRAADAFTTANQLPNNIYEIISTGVLTAVIVPQIVRASVHADGGKAFVSKLFTLGTVVLIGTTALAMVAAPWLVQLYARNYDPDQLALAIAFAYWCLPQIFFYGLYALFGEILNARRIFGPFTWAPIVNNVVSIIGFSIFIWLFGGDASVVELWSTEMIAVLAGTATLGIVVQTGVLLLFWRKAGLSLRPDFRWRGIGLRRVGRLAGWTFLMMIAGQIAGIVQSNILSDASGSGPAATAVANAWLLFMLPYSIIVMSIGTPYFTQLSEHASAGRIDEVRGDVGRSIRTLGVFIVISSVALAVAAVPASRIFTLSPDHASAAAIVLVCYLVGLMPMAVLYVIQRTFYAYDDTRTPFAFTVVQAGLTIVFALIAGATLPLEFVAAGVALGQSLATIIKAILAVWLLQRRIGGLRIGSWMWSLTRFTIAAIPAGVAGWYTFQLLGGASGWTVSNQVLGAVGAGIIGIVCVIVYLAALAILRAPELKVATNLVKRFLPGR